MTPLCALALAAQAAPSRFVTVAPFPALPYIQVDGRYCQGSFADEACRQSGLQGRVLWIDGTANLDKLGSDESIRLLLEKVRDVGFNTVVLDVKPIVGRTLYPSKLTDQLTSWRGKSIPRGYDPVAAARSTAARLGLSFVVSLNAFSEGHSYAKRDEGKPDSEFGDPGWGYRHPELQSVVYVQKPGTPTFRRSGEGQTQIPLMMNPHEPAVQARVLAFVKEVAERYRPDALLFDDRLRYHGLDADFSETTRLQFATQVRRKVAWPEDVYVATQGKDGKVGIRPGPLFDAWLAWRAETMAVFVERARSTLHAASPRTLLGVYAGSWYGEYGRYGSNYASSALQAGFPFLTRSFRRSGFAGALDLLVTGCYYTEPTIVQALADAKPPGLTVEAAGDVGNRVARDQCWVYAGIQLADFKGDRSALARALQAAAASTQGVMVFDLSHNIEDYWPVFQAAFAKRADPPHLRSDLLSRVRARRAALDKAGWPDRPFPMFEGAPGAGF